MSTPDETREFLTEMFDQIGERFDRVDERFDRLESDIDGRFGQLDEKVDRVLRENGALIDAVADINKRLG
ncbi:hypothetical protein [Candidatus Poriferisodalis sp.]|uniref:hypothetical protein n=1 Tax=Candidatus Poriferisodalis sp. TaxID=3101277 RepID=UPI003B02E075